MCSGSKMLIPQIMGTFEDKITIEAVWGGVFSLHIQSKYFEKEYDERALKSVFLLYFEYFS